MIYVLRHGQTDWNKLKLIQSQADIPLNNIGRQQAISAKLKLSDINFNCVYSSNLSRAKETAQIISGKYPITDNRLTEINSGKFEGMHVEEVKRIKRKTDYRPEDYDVELNEDVYKRVDSFFNDILPLHSMDNILIVSHAATCRVIIEWFGQLNNSESTDIKLPGNCEIMTFDIPDKYINN